MSAAARRTVNSLETSGSGLGDALVAFQQGAGDRAAIAAAAVDAAPLDFDLQTPEGWVRSKRSGSAGTERRMHSVRVTYTVTVSGANVARAVKATAGLASHCARRQRTPSRVGDGARRGGRRRGAFGPSSRSIAKAEGAGAAGESRAES